MGRPSTPPSSGSQHRSGWGIMPSTLRFSLTMPAMLASAPLGLASGGDFAIGGGVAEDDAVLALELGDGVRVREVVAVAVGDGDAEDITLLREGGESAVRCFHAQIRPLTAVLEVGVAEEGAGEEPGFAEDLKAVADAYDSLALFGHAADAVHDGGEAGDCAGTEVVAVGKAAGEDGEIVVGEVAFGVPDVVGVGVEDVGEDVVAIGVAPGAGEDDDGNAGRLCRCHMGIMA